MSDCICLYIVRLYVHVVLLSGADPGFQERGSICMKVCVGGGVGMLG